MARFMTDSSPLFTSRLTYVLTLTITTPFPNRCQTLPEPFDERNLK
jgi:hypothetical protein